MAKHHNDDTKAYAKRLYIQKYKISEIADKTGVAPRTLYNWFREDEWDEYLQTEPLENAIKRRIITLTEKEKKTARDLNESEKLIRQLGMLAKVRQQEITNTKLKKIKPSDIGAKDKINAITLSGTGKQKKGRIKKVKNDVSHLKLEDFKKIHKRFFGYQLELHKNYKKYRNRHFLKARQIGFTWYFAQEALEDAILNCRNKIFLSATRSQAGVFRTYIKNLAEEYWGITLSGENITLKTAKGPVTLYFLSTSSRSAQSYHGDVYIDEFFWIPRFNELYKVASAMAAHKKWRRTLFSTPSSVEHEAYELWTGDRFLKRFKNKEKAPVFPSQGELKKGIVCPDKTFRQIITLDTAEEKGCDLFDKNELKIEYSKEEYDNLFNCKFIDSAQAVFYFDALQACMIDTNEFWPDVDFNRSRPVNNNPVLCGYDPSRYRDDACFVVIEQPLTDNGAYRILERHKWTNKSYPWQSEQIKKICNRYNVQHMAIDVTGPGLGVIDAVKGFFPEVKPIHYSPEVKCRLVQKAKNIIHSGQLEFPAEWVDVGPAFLTIREAVTKNGFITYCAHRTRETGHADVAWAVMHALDYVPLNPDSEDYATVEIF